MPGTSSTCANSLKLVVSIGYAYGNPVIYPANEAADLVASLCGTKSLTARAIRMVLANGGTVEARENGGRVLDSILTGA